MRNLHASIRGALARGLPSLPLFFALLGVPLGGCTAMSRIGAPPPEQRARTIDAMLAAADFNVTPANTPARKEDLEGIAPLELRYRIGQGGNFHFWLADPYGCHCVFDGDQAAYLRYAKIEQETDWAEIEERDADGLVFDRTQINACLRYGMYPGLGCTRF